MPRCGQSAVVLSCCGEEDVKKFMTSCGFTTKFPFSNHVIWTFLLSLNAFFMALLTSDLSCSDWNQGQHMVIIVPFAERHTWNNLSKKFRSTILFLWWQTSHKMPLLNNTWLDYIICFFFLVYTKTEDSVFRALWLVTQSVNIQCRSLIHCQFLRASDAKTPVSCEQNGLPVCCRNKQRNFTNNQASCSQNTRGRRRSSVWAF